LSVAPFIPSAPPVKISDSYTTFSDEEKEHLRGEQERRCALAATDLRKQSEKAFEPRTLPGRDEPRPRRS